MESGEVKRELTDADLARSWIGHRGAQIQGQIKKVETLLEISLNPWQKEQALDRHSRLKRAAGIWRQRFDKVEKEGSEQIDTYVYATLEDMRRSEPVQPGEMSFEVVEDNGHSIHLGHDHIEDVGPALLMAAFSHKHLAPLPSFGGNFLTKITFRQAQELFESRRSVDEGNPFFDNDPICFVDYTYGKKLNFGIINLLDGGIQLTNIESEPLHPDIARDIFEHTKFILEQKTEQQSPTSA